MMITFDDFKKVEMKVGKIETVEPVEGADKLYKLTVDLGSEKRILVAGVAQQYKPEEINGKSIIVITNLEPRKVRGVLSQGMLLAAVTPDGKISIATVEREVSPGTPLI